MYAPRNASLLLLAVCLTLWRLVVAAADLELEVIDLHHRPADQIVTTVQPLLQQDEVVQAHGFQLILRARPDTIAQVRTLLQHLDRAPKRLLITVRQSDSSQIVDRGANAAVQAAPGDTRARVRVYSTDDRQHGAADQQIQVLEGNPAFISFGQSVPVGERTLIIGQYGASAQDSVRFRDVTTGFYVLPQVSGDQVRLQISPHRDTLSRAGGGAVNVQRADTVVSGLLGAWIELGGTVSSSQRGGGITYRTRERSEQQGRISVKVEELH